MDSRSNCEQDFVFSLFLPWFSMGRTTEMPSMAKMAVPKNRGSRSDEATHGTEWESGRGVEKM